MRLLLHEEDFSSRGFIAPSLTISLQDLAELSSRLQETCISQEAVAVDFILHMLGEQQIKSVQAAGLLCRPFRQHGRNGSDMACEPAGSQVDDCRCEFGLSARARGSRHA